MEVVLSGKRSSIRTLDGYRSNSDLFLGSIPLSVTTTLLLVLWYFHTVLTNVEQFQNSSRIVLVDMMMKKGHFNGKVHLLGKSSNVRLWFNNSMTIVMSCLGRSKSGTYVCSLITTSMVLLIPLIRSTRRTRTRKRHRGHEKVKGNQRF